MNLQKYSPWNWFKQEQPATSELLPRAYEGDPLTRIHREMDRMFENFFNGFDTRPGTRQELVLKPNIDISESRKAYRIEIEIPGVDENDIDLTVEHDALIVSGEKRQESEAEEGGFHRVERQYGSFRRVLNLPSDADADSISAKFKNGVLKINIPRTAEQHDSARRIKINS